MEEKLMQRLVNNTLGMLLHAPLYNRMVEFAKHYTPEFPCEDVVAEWLQALYANNPSVHILVNIEGNSITAHAVLVVSTPYNKPVLMCHQLKDDKKTSVFLDEVVEYGHKLCNEINAELMMFFTEKSSKAYEKKYGFKTARYVMVKNINE